MSGLVLSGHIALVTGAGRGLGRATALALAALGAHVVATSRTQGALEETDDLIKQAGGACTLLPLDLINNEALDAIGPSLFQRFGQLDILVHCAAALGRLTPASHIQIKDWDTAFAVNTHAALRLIRTCAPLLQASPHGRAVFVTDSRARQPIAYCGAYGASKAAMEQLVLSWAGELRDSNARINLFDPGPMATRLRQQFFPGEKPHTMPPPENAAAQLVSLCEPSETRHGSLVFVG